MSGERVFAAPSTGHVIAARVADGAARKRLSGALTARGAVARETRPVIWCDTDSALIAAIARGGVTLAIVAPEDIGSDSGTSDPGGAGEAFVHLLRAQFPSVPVLVYVPLTAAGARGVISMARAGASGIIVAGHDDLGMALSPLLDQAETASAMGRARQRLAKVTSDEVLSILTYALQHAQHAPTVADVARALGVNRKTLAAWCLRNGAPPAGVLVSWCRLIAAAHRLADPGRSAEHVAAEFGFHSGSTLAHLLRRHTGLMRAALRAQGGGIVVEMLAQRLAEGRVPPKRRRAPSVD